MQKFDSSCSAMQHDIVLLETALVCHIYARDGALITFHSWECYKALCHVFGLR